MEELKCSIGGDIVKHYRYVANTAKETGETYYFEGNGIIFIANKDSEPNLAEEFLQTCYEYKLPVLGPNEPMITDEYKEKIDKQREAERILREDEAKKYRQQEEADMLKAENLVRNEPLMLKEADEYYKWKSINTDLYGRTCFLYAEDLMRLLQLKKKLNGKIVIQDFQDMEYLIRKYSITGLQHGIVIQILKKHWVLYNELNF